MCVMKHQLNSETPNRILILLFVVDLFLIVSTGRTTSLTISRKQFGANANNAFRNSGMRLV